MSDATSDPTVDPRVLLLKLRASLTHALEESQSAERPLELDQAMIGRLTRIDAIQQQQMVRANRRASTSRLRQIDAALERIDAGEYGECTTCGEAIAAARLRIRPEAHLCVGCQERAEKR